MNGRQTVHYDIPPLANCGITLSTNPKSRVSKRRPAACFPKLQPPARVTVSPISSMQYPHFTPMTRRHALRQTVFYSAALALAGRIPSVEAQSIAPGDHHFLMLGDFGSHGQKPEHTIEPQIEPNAPAGAPFPTTITVKPNWTPQQSAVAAAMQSYTQAHGFSPTGLFLLGDNFYGSFKGGVNCPRWKTGFEDMYPASAFPGPCWAMLGNHDYDEESGLKMAAQLEYAEAHPGTRWMMPSKWYRVDWPVKDPIVTCLILDSNYKNGYLYLTSEEKAKQLKWLKAELAKPRTAPWMICMAHHPIYSNGMHGDNNALIKEWLPLLEQNNVAFYFSGHDHDLQHLEFEGSKTSFVISGGGGAHITNLKKPGRSHFSQSVNGFTHLQVNRQKIIVRHIDTKGMQLYAFSKTPEGKIEVSA